MAEKPNLVEQAKLKREQASRARRLAAATSASDVADGSRSYASELDKKAGDLEEQAAAPATTQQKSTPSKPQRGNDEATKNQHGKPTRPQ